MTNDVSVGLAPASLAGIFEKFVYSSNVFRAQTTKLKTGLVFFDPSDSSFDFGRRIDGRKVESELDGRTKGKSICWLDRHTTETDIESCYGDLFLISGDLYRYFTFIPKMGSFFMLTQISSSKIGPMGFSYINLLVPANAIP